MWSLTRLSAFAQWAVERPRGGRWFPCRRWGSAVYWRCVWRGCRGDRVEFRLLGPLEVLAAGRALPLGSAQQRAVLALLLIRAPEPVSRDRLVDELWGERPPATAAHAVQVH